MSDTLTRIRANPDKKAGAKELVRGLMRGDKDEFKQGYCARSAVLAAEHVLELDDVFEEGELLAYAEGFYDGMSEDANLTNPSAS